MIGCNKVLMPNKVIDTFFEWNTDSDQFGGTEYDKKMTVALLLLTTTQDDLVHFNVNQNVKDFIQGNVIKYELQCCLAPFSCLCHFPLNQSPFS